MQKADDEERAPHVDHHFYLNVVLLNKDEAVKGTSIAVDMREF